MQLTEEQQQIIKSLLDIKPRTGVYIMLSKHELTKMDEQEFIQLCKEVVPEQDELLTGFIIKKGILDDKPVRLSLSEIHKVNYHKIVFKNSLICEITKKYMQMELKELRKQFPSYFKVPGVKPESYAIEELLNMEDEKFILLCREYLPFLQDEIDNYQKASKAGARRLTRKDFLAKSLRSHFRSIA